jgi:hypothetical protein
VTYWQCHKGRLFANKTVGDQQNPLRPLAALAARFTEESTGQIADVRAIDMMVGQCRTPLER